MKLETCTRADFVQLRLLIVGTVRSLLIEIRKVATTPCHTRNFFFRIFSGSLGTHVYGVESAHARIHTGVGDATE